MTMIVINVHEAKAKLSEYLDAVAGGETVVICKRNHPVAELRAVAHKRTEPRPLGGTKGIVIDPSFFEPMPADWLDQFDHGPIFPPNATPGRVAESRPPYGSPTSRRRRK